MLAFIYKYVSILIPFCFIVWFCVVSPKSEVFSEDFLCKRRYTKYKSSIAKLSEPSLVCQAVRAIRPFYIFAITVNDTVRCGALHYNALDAIIHKLNH